MKTKTLTLNQRDYQIVTKILEERLEDLSLDPRDVDNIADVKYILSYMNSILWKE